MVKRLICFIFHSYLTACLNHLFFIWINSVELGVFQFLSMRLAAVNPRVDVNIDSILAAEVSINASASFLFQHFCGVHIVGERERGRKFTFCSISHSSSKVSVKLQLKFNVMLFVLNFQNEPILESNFPTMVTPLMWPEIPLNGNRQQYQPQWHLDAAVNQQAWPRDEHNHHNFSPPESSLLSYDSSANSGIELSLSEEVRCSNHLAPPRETNLISLLWNSISALKSIEDGAVNEGNIIFYL